MKTNLLLVQLVSCLTFLSCILMCNGLCDQRPYGRPMKCCSGRDSKCFVPMRNQPRNSTLSRKICYCDEYCLLTGDCCSDFQKIRHICRGARDCEVSNWSSWSKCSVQCGYGTMKRKRYVIQTSKNGGKPCPPVRQVRGCSLNLCGKRSETAFVLPESYRRVPYGSWGYEKILPAEAADYFKTDGSSYCVNFKLMFKRPHCQGTWAEQLESSLPVCVECQSRVKDTYGHCRGEGEMGIRTHWKALNLYRCHGEWIRLGPKIHNCTCTNNLFSNFVFV